MVKTTAHNEVRQRTVPDINISSLLPVPYSLNPKPRTPVPTPFASFAPLRPLREAFPNHCSLLFPLFSFLFSLVILRP